jgi:hypothetical protein
VVPSGWTPGSKDVQAAAIDKLTKQWIPALENLTGPNSGCYVNEVSHLRHPSHSSLSFPVLPFYYLKSAVLNCPLPTQSILRTTLTIPPFLPSSGVATTTVYSPSREVLTQRTYSGAMAVSAGTDGLRMIRVCFARPPRQQMVLHQRQADRLLVGRRVLLLLLRRRVLLLLLRLMPAE